MQPVSTLSVLTLLLAGASVGSGCGEDESLEDGPLWTAIVGNGDVLLGSTFAEAVVAHPLRVESLVFQRVIRPFVLLCGRLVEPWMSVEEIDSRLRNAWLGRNRNLRGGSGRVSIERLADSDVSAWKQNSRTLVDTMSVGTDETVRVREAMAANRLDIHRALSECKDVCDRACAIDGDHCRAWLVIRTMVEDMAAVVDHLMGDLSSISPFLPDVGLQPASAPSEYRGQDVDRFGAVSSFGYHGAHEEFIVSGHRAPSVGLPQYRRMGGRVFG